MAGPVPWPAIGVPGCRWTRDQRPVGGRCPLNRGCRYGDPSKWPLSSDGQGWRGERAGGGCVTEYVKIELNLLETTAQRLGQVADTLSRSRSTADQDAHVLAQADLASALGDFADNWRIRRENLIKAVEGAQKFVSGAVVAYRDLDSSMADAVTLPGGSGAKPDPKGAR